MEKSWTILSLLKWTESYFFNHSVPSPRIDGEILVSHALNMERIRLYTDFERILSAAELEKIKGFIKRRISGEPVAYIVGYKDFFGLKFFVDRNVLIPRPETELLVEEVLKQDLKGKTVLDIGAGSGNIGISVKRYCPEADVTLSDVSEQALETARKNAQSVLKDAGRVRFVHGDIFKGLEGQFHFIVSNPPYIPSSHIPGLDKTVRDFEPKRALEAGPDGLFYYQGIFSGLKSHLLPDGLLFLEMNPLLSGELLSLAASAGFAVLRTVKDYAGLDRIMVVRHE